MIKFKNVSKTFNKEQVLDNVCLDIDKGKLVVIIGKSGCGKTTLLKMINRLIEPSSGNIYYADDDIKKMDVIKLRRKIGYVIQQTGLFPHMTIRENIEIIPSVENKNKQDISRRTLELLHMIGMNPEEFLDRYPSELSGGQQQRIGVARAFANDPDVILMDEPFSALDPITRSDLQDELHSLQLKTKKTIVFVTHDMDEAIKIADMICIMRDGHILQYDTPENILKNPVDEFVSNFVGKNRIWSSPEFIKLSDIMNEHPITCYKEHSVLSCIEKMRVKHVDSLIVVAKHTHKLEGIIRARDIRRIEDRTQEVGQHMGQDVLVLKEADSILEAMRLLNESKKMNVAVVNDEYILKGIVTVSNLMTTLSQQYMEVE